MLKTSSRISGLSVTFCTMMLVGCANIDGAQTTTSDAVSPEAMLRVADDAVASGDLRTAAGVYSTLLAKKPDDITLRMKYADILAQSGSQNAAIYHYKEVIKRKDDHAEAHAAMGKLYFEQENVEEASKHLGHAYTISPTAESAMSYGAALDAAGDHRDAQATYRTGLAKDPSHTDLRNNLGLSLLMTGENEQAIDILKSVALKADATPKQRGNLALAYGASGRTKAAKRLLEKDLTPTQVEKNLEIYSKLRGKYNTGLKESVLMGEAGARVVE